MKNKRRRKHQSTGQTSTPPPTIPDHKLHRLAVAALILLPLVFYFRYLFGGEMLFGTDWLGAGGYQMRQFMSEYIRSHGSIAFWMPGILSGQPTVAAFFGDLFYPTQLFRLFVPVHVVWVWTFYAHVVAAGLGTYLFLKELKLSVLPAALGGIAYMFAGSLLTLTYAGHDGRLIGCALMPLALFFLHRGIARRQLLQFLLSGLMIALQLLSGHVQKVYYTGLILVAYFLFEWLRAVRRERSFAAAIRLVVFFIAGMGFGIALSAVQYLPIYGNLPFAARGAERGYEYATSWSMPINETLDLLSPHISGILGEYHGKNPFKLHSEYMGLVPLLFAVIGVIRGWKRSTTKFFLFAFALSLLMAWGGNTPFYRLPYHVLPGISKFRGPGMIFFLASFSIAVLAGIGANRLLVLLAKRGSLRGSVSLLLAAALAVLMTVDIGLSLRLWNPKRGYIRGVPPPSQYFVEDEAISFLKRDETRYRVMPLHYERSDNGVLMGFGIQSAGGQMPNPLQNYQDFIGSGSSVMFQAGKLTHPNYMNLLNIKYVIGPTLPEDASRYDAQSRQVIEQLHGYFADPRFEPAMVGRQYTVYRNTLFLPRAFFIPGFRMVRNKEEVLHLLSNPDFPVDQAVLLYDDPGFGPTTDSMFSGTVDVVAYDANRIELSTVSSAEALLVLSENWHPAWKATVDGNPVTVLRAYHTLRAIRMGPGEHTVVFRYESGYCRAGAAISISALVLLLAVFAVTLLRRKRPQAPVRETQATEAS